MLKLDNTQLEILKSAIQDQLTRRGILAKIVEMTEVEDQRGRNRIEFRTEKFQTVPVLFKALSVSEFNSSISTETITREDKSSIDVHKIWMTVHAGYSHFDGGTNGVQLFTVNADAYKLDNRSEMQSIKFSS
jgi:hypothetical protein